MTSSASRNFSEDVLTGGKDEIEIDLPQFAMTVKELAQKTVLLLSALNVMAGQVRIRQQIGPFVQDPVRPCPQCRVQVVSSHQDAKHVQETVS